MEEFTEIYLDLHKNELLGWEPSKSALLIACMIEGIKLGHKFPVVNIIHKKNNIYQIIRSPKLSKSYAGHHRAVAHYIEQPHLRCHLFKQEILKCEEYMINYLGIPIKKIILEDPIPYHALKDSLLHLPEEVAKGFCNENNLNFKEYYLNPKNE